MTERPGSEDRIGAPRRSGGPPAFSLVELVIVVVIIGILGAIGVSRFTNTSKNARLRAAATACRNIEVAVRLYYAEHGELPGDRGPGQTPAGFDEHVARGLFDRAPPLGTAWDWNPAWGPVQPNIGMQANPGWNDLWQEFDERFDDGSLSTGRIRRANATQIVWQIDLPR